MGVADVLTSGLLAAKAIYVARADVWLLLSASLLVFLNKPN